MISGLVQLLLRLHETAPYYIIYSFYFRYIKVNIYYDLQRNISQDSGYQ